MPRFFRLLFALSLTIAVSAFAQSTTNTDAATTASTVAPVAYAYVGSNTSPNKVTAFSVLPNGSAHLVPGSPFIGPSNYLNVSSGYLFGADLTHIATFTRTTTGGLRLTSLIDGTARNDTPTGSGLSGMTLDHTGRNLYVGEINFQGTENDAYAAFTVGAGGKLQFVANSNINVDYNSPLAFSPNNQFAYGQGCHFANWDVFGLKRSSNGTVAGFDTKARIPPSSSGFVCPSASAVSARGYLAVAFGEAFSGSVQSVAMYHINSDGTLSLIAGSEQPTRLTGVGGMTFDPTGTFLAVAGQNGLYMYRLLSNGKLAVADAPLATAVSFVDVRWDHRGHLFALSATALFIFDSSNGVLSPASGSPHAVAKAQSLAVLPVQ
jgi:hypothetical protein